LDFATRYLKIGVTNNQSFVYHFVVNLPLYRKHQKLLPVSSATAAASRHGFWMRKRVFRSLRVKMCYDIVG